VVADNARCGFADRDQIENNRLLSVSASVVEEIALDDIFDYSRAIRASLPERPS
jgi:hypothetical protein